MNRFIKPIYAFCDIYIFGKAVDGYINLSDFEITQRTDDIDKYKFESNEKYLIGLQSAQSFIIAPITIDEILTLANYSLETKFVSQCRSGIYADDADALLAIMCAKKILNYQYGVVRKKDTKNIDGDEELLYSFFRRKHTNGKRSLVVVLEKYFKIF